MSRQYTPVSDVNCVGHFDLLIKVKEGKIVGFCSISNTCISHSKSYLDCCITARCINNSKYPLSRTFYKSMFEKWLDVILYAHDINITIREKWIQIIGQAWPPGVYTYLDIKVEETYNYQDIQGAISSLLSHISIVQYCRWCGTFLISVYTCTRVISKSSFSTLRQQCEVLTLYMKFLNL